MKQNETTQELKSLAKAVGASLKRQGHAVPHGVLLNALASAGNLRDWQKLLAHRQQPESTCAPTKELSRVDLLGARLDGVLRWQGWNVPATLDIHTGLLDAGDFHLEERAIDATFEVRHPKWGEFTLRQVSYLPKAYAGEAQGRWLVPPAFFNAFVAAVKERAQAEARNASSVQGPDVSARFWTDDHVFEVDFKANAFLQQASDEALSKILNVGCSGDPCTDNIAGFMLDNTMNEEIADAFNYLHARNTRGRDGVGFEVQVDEGDFYRWLDANRPIVLAKYLCEQEGITLSEAQEEEIRGRWDWHDNQGNASEASLGTQDEAALDAYRSLGLLEEAFLAL